MVELPTFANKVTRIMTGFKYSHASVSLDENLSTLYSFQIRNRKLFLVGGFIEETRDIYFHGKNNVILSEMVFKVPVSDDEYEHILKFIQSVKNDCEYTFNYVSALFMFTFGGVKSYKAFHCVEFVSEVLLRTNSVAIPKEPHKMLPKDLYKALMPYKIKDSCLKSEDFEYRDDLFMKKIKIVVAIKKSVYSVREAICRAILKRTSKKFDYRKVNVYEYDTSNS